MRAALSSVGRYAVLAWWYGIVPVALTAVTLRYVVPAPATGEPSLVTRLAHEQPVVTAAVVFLAFSAIVRTWSAVLPGARVDRPHPRNARRRTVLLVLATVLAAAAGVAVGRAFQPARVVSTSMVPTIFPGDRLWVDKRAYRDGAEPRRGDVIVFQHAGGAEGEPGALAKRVIAIAGDHIEMRDSHPVLNGHEIPSCEAGGFAYFGASQFSRGRLSVEWLDGRAYLTVQEPGPHTFAGYDVKPGEVFVLGDNRGVSNDSRSWHGSAGVARSAIAGRVDRVLFGDDRGGGFDWDRVWRTPGTDLQLTGVDIAALQAGIAQCLRTPPPEASER